MSDETGDTEVAGDTVAASEAGSTQPAVKIRPSRPSLQGGDYADLVVIDRAHYVIQREIARGGMGRIQVARDRRLGREVAVKEVLSDKAGLVRRFEREVRITARLQHPSIVSVLEAGVWPSGEPFYAMPFVSGRSLDEAIAAARTFEQRLALLPNVLAVADAMAYAHGQKVIHRDLKPRNIVVGEFGETVVIDWGLAKELGSASLDSEPNAGESGSQQGTSAGGGETTLGDVLGTPSYMPPEQAAGAAVDERADVYAIGSILYHVLAGEPPYGSASNVEILAALRHGPPRAIRAHVPNAPEELCAVVERAMARDLDARYRSSRELAEDLRRFQTGQLVGAHRYSMRQLLKRWVRRYRTVLVAVGAAAAVALAVGAFALVRIVEAHRLVEQQRALAQANQKRAEALTSFMLTDLRAKLTAVGRLELLDEVARRAAAYYDDRGDVGSDEEQSLAALARMAIGDVMRLRGDGPAARAEFEKSEALLVPVAARHPESVKYGTLLAAARFYIIKAQTAQGDLPGALARTRVVLADVENMLPAHPGDIEVIHKMYLGHSGIAGILESQGDLDGALAEYERALAIAVPTTGDRLDRIQKDVLNVHANLARIMTKAKRDPKRVLEHYRVALDIGERQVAADPKSTRWLQDVAVSHNEIGGVLEEQGDHDGALAEHMASLAVAERLVAFEPTNQEWKSTLGDAHGHLCTVLLAKHDHAGALSHCRARLEIVVAAVAADPDNLDTQAELADTKDTIGDVQLATGDAAAALSSYREGLAIQQKLVEKTPTNADWRHELFAIHDKIADALGKAGRPAEQLAELRAALALAEATAAGHATNPELQKDLADVRAKLQALDKK
jgi:tetratricopeptide (TPR) repeat protein